MPNPTPRSSRRLRRDRWYLAWFLRGRSGTTIRSLVPVYYCGRRRRGQLCQLILAEYWPAYCKLMQQTQSDGDMAADRLRRQFRELYDVAFPCDLEVPPPFTLHVEV